MNNYNFASWELTQMLPEINPYQFIEDDDYPNSHKFKMKWYNIDDIITIQPSNSGLFDRGFDYLRDAWTWEDIRLYLEERGYILKISPYVDIIDEKSGEFQIFYYFDIIYSSTGESEDDFTYYHTYKEARREAIIYCLNNIDNG